MNLKTTRSQHGLINHVFSVCHSYDQDVVEAVYSVNFGQELIYNSFLNPCA